jgi:hypothetical protein
MSRSETGELRDVRPRPSRAGALWLALAISLAFALPALAQGAGLVASIEPSEIALGESAQLSVSVTGDATPPRIPTVDGLEIESAGRSTQIQIVNGQVSRSTSFVYDVRPLRTGSFTLPALEGASASGESLSTGPLALRVVPSGAGRAAAPPASSSAANAEPDTADAAQARETRFEVVRSTDELFVGQLERVELRLLVPDGVELAELAAPRLTGAGFTITALAAEQPQESRTVIGGVPTTVLTWQAAVSAVKPGAQQLDASIEAVVAVRDPARGRRSARPGLFGDDFFGGSLLEQFFGNVRRQRLHLESQPLRVEVQALPDAGRPADFAGAVGEFRFAAQAKPVRAVAGDPVTLELTVEGSGNFDRVSVAGLGNGDGFKAYTPSARFEGTDPTGVEGRKLFEQPIIPEHGGAQSVPPQHFSYFDPKTRQYVTLHSDALPLEVTGAAAPTQPAGVAQSAEDASAATGSGVLPLRRDLGRLRHDTRPLFLRPAFFVALALPLLALGLCAGFGWRRRRRLEPMRARAREAERAVRESLRDMEDACARADAPAFHAAARRALQARLGQRLDVNPAAVTLADVEARLADDPRLAASVRRVLERADAFAYAGSVPDGAALGSSRGFVLETLKQLEVSR